MRYDNVFRVLVLALAAGSLLGLLGGLLFGGPDSQAVSPKIQAEAATGDTDAAAGAAGPMTSEQARSIGANELGQIPVLEYHKIGTTEAEWTRTPDNFRKDIELLQEAGFHPVNLRDLVNGNLDVPPGKSPVVITFDDSSPGQYRILADGKLDPNSGVSILQKAAETGDWPSRATFFLLLDVQPDDNVLFGQPERQQEKVRNLVAWGYEVGAHTVTHLNLKKASKAEAMKQLTLSKAKIESLAGGGYVVETISIPFGAYPDDDSLLVEGEYQGETYAYRGAVEVTGGPSPSPFSDKFKPLHIPRIIARGSAVQDLIEAFRQRPELRYVSDGDAAAVSAPKDLAPELGGVLPELGRPLVSY